LCPGPKYNQNTLDDLAKRLPELIESLLAALAILSLLPVTVLFSEVLLASTAGEVTKEENGSRPTCAVLVPAHDEAAVITRTLRTILPQLEGTDRLLVVADNCSDETAAIAASAGAEVVVRSDASRLGKGYALDAGVRRLESTQPEVVIIIDADCEVTTGSIDRLARTCYRTGRPVQALYLMTPPQGAGLKSRIAQFAWIIKNHARPMGLRRLGLPCQLMGTGMAFPWKCISEAKLATGHLVEDLSLGIELARAGKPPIFCPEAVVLSTFPSSSKGIQSQRTRWEHGHLSIILHDAPRLLAKSFLPPNIDLCAMALDLSVPPIALLVLQMVVIWTASAVFAWKAGRQLPLAISTAGITLLVSSVLLGWQRYGRGIISIGKLALTGLYVLWKIPMYLRFLIARQTGWIRSSRDDDK
jgi:cellulose synthase/poly-beta-1,6-N-acetylglucosamine synthase-like glycosyltransferase